MSIEVKDFRKYEKGTLLGFATLFLPTAGVEINGVGLHTKAGQQWVSMPSRQFQADDGSTKYAPYIRFPDKARWGKFQAEAISALEEHLSQHDQRQPDAEKVNLPF